MSAKAELIFGVGVPASAGAGDDPVGLAQEAERLGYDFVSAADHPCGPDPSYETATMLTWIAARTSRIKVASRVMGRTVPPPGHGGQTRGVTRPALGRPVHPG